MLELKFQQRPVDVPTNLRLYGRLAMLIISISECCSGNAASLRQLHFINSLFIDKNFLQSYLQYKKDKKIIKILCPSADPYLNRCIGYAIGLNLISQKIIQSGFRLALTQEGADFMDTLKESELVIDAFSKARLIGKISEAEIKRIGRLEQ